MKQSTDRHVSLPYLFKYCCVVLWSSLFNIFCVLIVAPGFPPFIWRVNVKCVLLLRFPKLLQIWRPSVCKMPTKTPCSLGYPPVITLSGLQSHVSFSEVRWGKSLFVCLNSQKPPIYLFTFSGLRRSRAQAPMWLFLSGVPSCATRLETTSFRFEIVLDDPEHAVSFMIYVNVIQKQFFAL